MVELNNEKAKGLVIWWVKFRDDELRSSNLVHTTKYEDGLKFDNNQTVFEIDDVTKILFQTDSKLLPLNKQGDFHGN